MMFRGRIAAVSYLNTIPFIYGIEHAAGLRADLVLSPPSRCAALFDEGRADVALLPAGALCDAARRPEVLDGYCIGAHGPVRTVVVMSDSPIERIERIWLDSHSMTSALLARILCTSHWDISPEFVQLDDYSRVDAPAEGDAFLLIGDKVFDYEGRFRHARDLAAEWIAMTGLPFVFAVWVAREGISTGETNKLKQAFAYGVGHIDEAIGYYGHSGKPYAHDYLTRNIDFIFDEQKHRALSLFWDEGRKFSPRVNPG